MTEKKQAIKLLVADILSLFLVWLCFFVFRKKYIENYDIIFDENFVLGIILVPLFWLILYFIQGSYRNVIRKYRLKTLSDTLIASIIGTIFIFFLVLIDDVIYSYKQYYLLFFGLLIIHFVLTIIPRLIIITLQVKKIHKGIHGFPTLIIGGGNKAIEILNEFKKLKQSSGNKIIGFVNINGSHHNLDEHLPLLGHFDEIDEILKKYKIEEVVIALETNEHEKIKNIVSQLYAYKLKINLIPDVYDILSGQVKMSSIYGVLLLRLNQETMPEWQISSKRIIDISISLLALIILFPFLLIIALMVKLSSKGSVFFTQERIGIDGKPFQIIKFRTMVTNAEKNGPQLSSSNDERITKLGKFLRKTRIDEFPQFLNVLKGDMSIVGPRPERQFYIEQIKEKDPQYMYLHKVRPGITSWGQVKFGYAENVDEMVQRMKFDLLYIRNRSLALDIKIMFYTIAIILKAKGK